MKKYLIYILITITVASPLGLITNAVLAGGAGGEWGPGYTLLAPLPCDSKTPGCGADGRLTTYDPAAPGNNLGTYLNIMIRIVIGIAAVLSVVMIVIGGVEYMTSELAHTKESGKDRITHAIFGLIIALGAYALLFTINPDLLISDPKIETTAPPANVGQGTGGLGKCTVVGSDGITTTIQTTKAACDSNPKKAIPWESN